MNVTWAPLLLGLVCAVLALGCGGAALRSRRFPTPVRVLLGAVAVPLAGVALLGLSIGFGLSGR